MTFRIIIRVTLVALALPVLYFGAASAAYLLRFRADNILRAASPLPSHPRPQRGDRILIFAPHCDDEALGCAGLIQQAVAAGAKVRVVMITNGDGFRVAVEREYRKLRVSGEDYVKFARLRQLESINALARLGLQSDNIEFFGYPDRGLTPLWNQFWSPDKPYRSHYTGADRSPYQVAFHPGAIYCAQSLLEDLKQVMSRDQPTHIYVTHPSDDHPDHTAASAFVELALRQFQSHDSAWAKDARLSYYLVHRGDWPIPQGLHKDSALAPPAEMSGLDTRWSELRLTDTQVRRKEEAILAYPSQTAVMKRFLLSFARQNEIFGELPDTRIPRVPDNMIHPDGSVDEWAKIEPAVVDPVNDNLIRDFQAGGDVRAIYACRDSRNLYLRLDARQPISPRVEYRLRIRYFGDSDTAGAKCGGSYTALLRPNMPAQPADIQCASQSDRIEAAIPLRELGYSRSLSISAESSFAGIQIDRTGIRFLN